MRRTHGLFVVGAVMLAASLANADSACKTLTSGSADERDTQFLAIVDEIMKLWPQHDTSKKITTRDEQLALWKCARQQIEAECAQGKEFAAGIVFGEALSMYKMSLLDAATNLPNVP